MNGGDRKRGRGREILALQQTGASEIMTQLQSTDLCVRIPGLGAEGDPRVRISRCQS